MPCLLPATLRAIPQSMTRISSPPCPRRLRAESSSSTSHRRRRNAHARSVARAYERLRACMILHLHARALACLCVCCLPVRLSVCPCVWERVCAFARLSLCLRVCATCACASVCVRACSLAAGAPSRPHFAQCLKGEVKAHYAAGTVLEEAGVVPGGDMTPEAALVKLGWLLARCRGSRSRSCALTHACAPSLAHSISCTYTQALTLTRAAQKSAGKPRQSLSPAPPRASAKPAELQRRQSDGYSDYSGYSD